MPVVLASRRIPRPLICPQAGLAVRRGGLGPRAEDCHQRYGPFVQGAGIHHNPTPGPANSPHVYGHIWVVLGLLAVHPAWGVIALPLLARMYVRAKDLPGIYPQHRPGNTGRRDQRLRLAI